MSRRHLACESNFGNYHYILLFCIRLAGVHSAAAYQELTAKIEFFNKCICLAITLTLAILYISVLPFTFVRYYIFNMGEDSFELFYPPWFVFCSKNYLRPFVKFAILLAFDKVSVQLEDTIWIFDGLVGSMCWSAISGKHLHSIYKSAHRIVLVFHLHRGRHYSGFGRV